MLGRSAANRPKIVGVQTGAADQRAVDIGKGEDLLGVVGLDRAAVEHAGVAGRTFIEPQQSIRHFGVKLKLSPIEATLRGRRVVVVDDSIVRGTTSRKIVKMVRDAGAKEVHLRISSPPTAWPCYYGIDTPTRRELIASSHTLDEIACLGERRDRVVHQAAFRLCDGELRLVEGDEAQEAGIGTSLDVLREPHRGRLVRPLHEVGYRPKALCEQ